MNTPTRPRRRTVLCAALAVGVVATATGLLLSWPQPAAAGAGRPGAAADRNRTVTVARGDVTEIVTLSSSLVPEPHFTLPAPVAGRVDETAAGAGASVAAGRQLFRVGGTAVTAPVAATVVRWLVPDGTRVGLGVPVAELAYPGFGEVAGLPDGAGYRILNGRLTARADVTDGPGPFDCPVLQSPPAAGSGGSAQQSGGGSGDGPQIVCAVPLDVRAYAGLSGTVAVASGERRGVLTLPQEAVAGSVQQGEVTVVGKDGGTRIRTVGLGLSDGSVVEVTSGLAEGDTVLAAAPALSARLP
ncbi:hypothetical protein ACEZCY_13835 [Streptacidiphilus sp. N1-12]|uniref:Multidrug resistance protein MdtA-like C-terminal permuted SH3 domain-containing protein n=2 Tax=Streptacidiphilus alkalitolerans TaxID=3342712 RepID=A0ABV6V9D9_9ACTN